VHQSADLDDILLDVLEEKKMNFGVLTSKGIGDVCEMMKCIYFSTASLFIQLLILHSAGCADVCGEERESFHDGVL
jgi:hypothetical protein